MPVLRYIGGMPVVLQRADGTQIELNDGQEVELTEAEAQGCACKPARADGVWEHVRVFGVTEGPLEISGEDS